MKVLISAYSCEPSRGSEPGVGWNWVLQAAARNEVWVLTRPDKKERILKEADRLGLDGVHWVFYELPLALRFWRRGQRGIRLHYLLWQLGARSVVRDLHSRIGFDVAHHATFVVYWMPACLAWVDAPFVWGPVGAGESAPSVLSRGLGWRWAFYERLRDFNRALARFSPYLRRTARSAAVALATTEETAMRIDRLGAADVRVLSQVALSDEELAKLEDVQPASGRPFRFMSVGRLLHWKGFDLGLEAFASVSAGLGDSEYWIVGDGEERRRLSGIVDKRGLGDRVRFIGMRTREELWAMFAEADVLVHPSLHDSGGMVVAEAMAAGLPAICLDLGGPALQVDASSGFKIAPGARQQVIEDIAEAMVRLATDEALRTDMACASRERIRTGFSWSARGEVIEAVYSEVSDR